MDSKDVLSNWMNMQKDAVDFWQNQMKKMTEQAATWQNQMPQMPQLPMMPPMPPMPMMPPVMTGEGAEGEAAIPMQDLANSANAIMAEYQKNMKDLTEQWMNSTNSIIQEQMKRSLTNMEGLDYLKKIANGSDTYKQMYEMWSGMADMASTPVEQMSSQMEQWGRNYEKFFFNAISMGLPTPIRDLMLEQAKFLETAKSLEKRFVQPWLGHAKDLRDLLARSMAGEETANAAILKIWRTVFDESAGHFLNLPVFAMNPRMAKEQMEAVDSWIDFLLVYEEFISSIMGEAQQAFATIIEDYQELLKSGEAPTSFTGFYDLWSQKSEQAFVKFFSTDAFSRLMSQVLSSWLSMKKEVDDLMIAQIKLLPLPTPEDMDSVYKKLDLVRRDVRELKKASNSTEALEAEVATLKRSVDSLKKSLTASEKEVAALKTKLESAPAPEAPEKKQSRPTDKK